MVNNPNFYGQSVTGTPSQISDDTDYPHTGLIKALSLGMTQNYVISGFDITINSATSIDVGAGEIFRDGKKVSISATGSSLTLSTTYTNGYHLLVVNGSSILLRSPSATEGNTKVPPYTDGDTIIAMITYDGNNPMPIQYFTTNKTENSLSLGYDNSGYTETGTLTADANGITMTGLYKLDTLPTATVATDDKIILQDTNDSDIIKTATAQQIADLSAYNSFNTDFAAKNTDDLSEGSTNLYYTNARAISAVEGESTLDLTGAVTVQTDLKMTTSSDDAIIENVTLDKDIIFKVNDGGVTTEVLRIDGSTGNVGIRLNQNVTADERLDVEDGNISLTTTSRTTERIIKLRNSGSTTSLSEIAMAGANSNNYEGYIAFRTKGPDDLYNDPLNEIMRIDGNGKVGIGETAPSADLHIKSSSNFDPTSAINTATLILEQTGGTQGDDNESVGMTFTKINSGRPFGSIAGVQTGSDADVGGLAFFTHDALTSTDIISEKMRIEGNGNVGIGTTTPETKLHVNGGFTSTGIRSAVAEAIGNSGPANHTFDSDDYFLHTKSIASTPPNPPNSVNITIPAASSTIIGQRYRILCSANAGGIDDVVISFDSGDSVYDATHVAGSTTQSLTGGKLYDIICVSGSEWFLLVLN